jgi:hypothetical protein
MIGLKNTISLFNPAEQQLLETGKKYACSSTAGGLRVIAVGLVPVLAVEAGRQIIREVFMSRRVRAKGLDGAQ